MSSGRNTAACAAVCCLLAGLLALGFSYFDRPTGQPAKRISQDGRLGQFSQPPQIAPDPIPSVARMDAAIDHQGSRRASEPAYFSPSARQSSAPSFKFLGKLTEGDETLVLLYGGGRTLAVRGVGPVDDDYVVDAIGEAYVVLRDVPLGESQVIQLTSQEPTIETGWSAENTPQD